MSLPFEIHQGYNYTTLHNDLCILKLTHPFPKSQFNNWYLPVMNRLIDGWGGTENSSRFRGVDDLRTVNVTLLAPINCSLYREQFDGEIMICAGDRVRQKRLQKIILLTLYMGFFIHGWNCCQFF